MLTTFANRAKMAAWAAKIERIVAKPPGSIEEVTPDSLKRESKVTFSKLNTWTIICEEMLDTQFERAYFEKAWEELHRRGITDAEIAEMRRFAWLTAGWLNFECCLWEWCNMDEQDIYRAIEWQYSDGYISAEERTRRLEYARKYAQSP